MTYDFGKESGPGRCDRTIVEDIFPAELMDVTYTSTVTGVVSGETPSGNGNISDTVNMTLIKVSNIRSPDCVSSTAGEVTNTASITPPDGVVDPDQTNSTSTIEIPVVRGGSGHDQSRM